MRRILLLRGVNVGGVKLPMAEAREMLAGLGLLAVKSHIQSGNFLFEDPGLPDLPGQIAAGLKAGFGLGVDLFFYTPAEMAAIAEACPYASEGRADGAKVHVFFLAEPSSLQSDDLSPWITSEQVTITDRAIYLHAPDGIGRSKLAEKLVRRVKVPMTARNWNTVQALLDLSA